MSKASYDGPVSIWCKGLFLDLAYFRRQLISGLADDALKGALLAIQLSRYYPKSAGNEARYQTLCAHLEELSAEFPRLQSYAVRGRELLAKSHLSEASPETLVDFCLAEQKREPLPLREIYQNAPFQLIRMGELSEEYERAVYQRALETETASGWFSLTEKLDRLFSNEEILDALRRATDSKIRKGLLQGLVSRE